MLDTTRMIGITDTGQPLVLAEHTCEFWQPGRAPEDNVKSCWYCRYADFGKPVYVTLAQSVCRCPQNQIAVIHGSENEQIEQKEGSNQ